MSMTKFKEKNIFGVTTICIVRKIDRNNQTRVEAISMGLESNLCYLRRNKNYPFWFHQYDECSSETVRILKTDTN